MTAQFADGLINECAEVDLSGLHLYAVIVGDIKSRKDIKAYPFSQKGNPEKYNIFSCCWSGYIPKYKITKDKELLLIGFEYPALLPDRIEPDEAYELATGDFWLDLRPDFFGGFVYVPFKSGKLITDKKEWIFHEISCKNANTASCFSKVKRIFKY